MSIRLFFIGCFFLFVCGFFVSVEGSYEVCGRVIFASERLDGKQVFRFFNDVEGRLDVPKGMLNIEAAGRIFVPLSRGSTSVSGGMETTYCSGRSCDSEDWKLSFHIDNLVGLKDHRIPVGKTSHGYLLGGMRLMGVYQRLEVPVKIHRYSTDIYLVEPVDTLVFVPSHLEKSSLFHRIMNSSEEKLQDHLRLYFKFIVQR